jgi:DNA-binding transcriptional ArsR family regulator
MTEKSVPVCKTVCFNADKIDLLRRRLPDAKVFHRHALRHKAQGHPVRQAILHLLAKEECCVCDLANILELPVSTVSQHLQKLASADLLVSRQQGKLVFYALAEELIPSEV